MTPSMYVVCSAHICQGLRGWEGAAGGLAALRKAEGRSGELESVCLCVCWCVGVILYRTPAVTEKPNTLYLLWKN